MKQILVNGLLVWEDDYFQRGAFARHAPEIDPDEAEAALVAAVLKYPARAAALSKALAQQPEPKPYTAPAWAGDEEMEARVDREIEAWNERLIATAERNREALEDG